MGDDETSLRLPMGFVNSLEGLTYYEGHINQEHGAGSFLEVSERPKEVSMKKLYAIQPAQFQPRTHWQHWYQHAPVRPHIDLPLDRIIPRQTKPTKQYDGNGMHDDLGWKQQCEDLWELYRTLNGKQMSLSVHLQALIRLCIAGMADTAVAAKTFIRIGSTRPIKNPTHDKDGSDQNLPAGVQIINDTDAAIMSQEFAEEWRKRLAGRRFEVGLAHHVQAEHWTTYIWDRVEGHLIVYDTISNGAEARLKALALCWRQRLANAGLTYNFSVFGMPVTDQPGTWECGYLGVYLLFLNLRGQVGADNSQVKSRANVRMVSFDGVSRPAPRPCAIRHRDWILDPWVTSNASLVRINIERMREFIGTVILDQLGIKDRKIQSSSGLINVCGTLTSRYEPCTSNNINSVNDAYTWLGGRLGITWPDLDISGTFGAYRACRVDQGAPFFKTYFHYFPHDTIILRQPPQPSTEPDQGGSASSSEQPDPSVSAGTEPIPAGPTSTGLIARVQRHRTRSNSPPLAEEEEHASRGRPFPKRLKIDVETPAFVQVSPRNRKARATARAQPRRARPTVSDSDGESDLFVRSDSNVEEDLVVPAVTSGDGEEEAFEPTVSSSDEDEDSFEPPPRRSTRASKTVLVNKAVSSDKPTTKASTSRRSRRHKSPVVHDDPVIHGSNFETLSSRAMASERRLFEEDDLGTAGYIMTREVADALAPPTVPNQPVQYLPALDEWCSYIPPGLMARAQWSSIVSVAYDAVFPPEPARPSRAERLARRNEQRQNGEI